MISWLKGEALEKWILGSRQGIIINCSGVGYEVQLLTRNLEKIVNCQTYEIWVHHYQREDISTLFGFLSRQGRDIFRVVISVNGVGPQMGMALLEEFSTEELTEAIIKEDIRKLSKAQGVGKRTAERLSIELRNKITVFANQSSKAIFNSAKPEYFDALPYSTNSINDVRNTLESLGYENIEISNAMRAFANKIETEASQESAINSYLDEASTDDLLKETLKWLSQKPT